jgi:hypothetical protein
MAQGEVETYWIIRIEASQCARDVRSHSPARAGIRRQTQAATQPDDVRVERHDELRGGHGRPRPEVDFIGPHHPTEVQVQPFAGAAG